MPPQGHELYRRVQQAAEGTPYAVTETEKGFDVTLNVVDAEWYGVFNKAGLQQVYVHHVRFPRTGVYTITDDSRTLEWVAGVPRIAASMTRQYGRVIHFGAKKVWAFDDHGRSGVQADYRFSSEEGRDLITVIAGQLGLEQRRGTAEKIGIYVGVVALIGAAISVVVNLVLWLTGYYG